MTGWHALLGAEIPIVTADPSELDNLQARLASPETFRRIGLAKNNSAVPCSKSRSSAVLTKIGTISIVSSGSPIYFDSEKCRAEYQSR